MSNSSCLEDVTIIYTHILLLMWHLNTQQLLILIAGHVQRGDITVYFVKRETYCISFEEFDAQFNDPGAHVY